MSKLTRWPWLLALAALVYLGVLVATLPARFVFQWLPDSIAVARVDGTAWRGHAVGMSAGGFVIDELDWRLRPTGLLRGRARAHVEGRLAGGFFEGDLSATAAGRVDVRDLRAALPLAALGTAAGFGDAGGQLSLDLQTLRLADGWPVAVDGIARVGNLRVPELDESSIGDYELQFSPGDGDVTGRLRDRGGPLEVTGRLELATDRQWALDGTVRPRDDASARLQELLSMLGSADAEGWREFSLAGRL